MPVNSVALITMFKNLFESDWAETVVTALKPCIMF